MQNDWNNVPSNVIESEDEREEWKNLANEDDTEEPLSHVEDTDNIIMFVSIENVIDDLSEGGLMIKLIVRLDHNLLGHFDEISSINEWFLECFVLVFGISQLNHLSLEDHWGEIDVIEADFDSFIMLLFCWHIFLIFVNQSLESIDDLVGSFRWETL